MRRGSLGLGILVALVSVGASGWVQPAGAVVPAGFTDDLVATVGSPTAMAFTPDGRLLITTQGGLLRVVQNGALLPGSALNLTTRICATSERGLLGVAVDPGFGVGSNRFIYLYFTDNQAGTCVNRVTKWTLGDNNVVTGEQMLIDKIHSTAGNHNGGDLNFGKDGLLYVSVGDGGCDYAGSGCAANNDAAQDLNVMVGKILRITKDGTIPAGNPFSAETDVRCNVDGITSVQGARCQEIYAWGLRNPFRTAFDPNAATTRFYINDVGQSTWEEIDLGTAGANYGWNAREGHCATGSTTNCGTVAGLTNPIFDYGRGDGCGTITGGAFVPNNVWPAAYSGKYMFADYNCGRIFRLDPNGSGGFNRVDFATIAGVPVHLLFGPFNGTQALYYTTYANGGEVRRITATAQSQTVLSVNTGDPGQSLTATGSGARSANVAYVLKLGNTSAACRQGIQIGGPRNSDANGNIPSTAGIVPGNVAPGTRWICFARQTDSFDNTTPAPFSVL